jgi:hypothetical protein
VAWALAVLLLLADPHVGAGEIVLWWLNLATLLGWLLSSIFVLAAGRSGHRAADAPRRVRPKKSRARPAGYFRCKTIAGFACRL